VSLRTAGLTLLAIALVGCSANAYAGKAGWTGRPMSGEGVPAWVVQECRPANGAEILGRFAGAGYWFYRSTGDFCYFDRRPGVL
jgi:hypothetical protein